MNEWIQRGMARILGEAVIVGILCKALLRACDWEGLVQSALKSTTHKIFQAEAVR